MTTEATSKENDYSKQWINYFQSWRMGTTNKLLQTACVHLRAVGSVHPEEKHKQWAVVTSQFPPLQTEDTCIFWGNNFSRLTKQEQLTIVWKLTVIDLSLVCIKCICTALIGVIHAFNF